MNYTVSCSSDITCPPNFTTTDNTIRSYTITNLAPLTNYTFSVVATNSIGSGEAGVVMLIVGEVINATIAPSVVSMSTVTPSEGPTTISTMGTVLIYTAMFSRSSITAVDASTSAIKTTTATATATTISTITTTIVPSTDQNMISTSSSENMMTTTTAPFITTTSNNIAASNTITGDILRKCKIAYYT